MIPIILGTYGWGLLAGYMDDYSSCIVGDMMIIDSYLYDDRLIDADIPNWWYLVHADLNGYDVFHIWYNVNDFMMMF